MYVFSYICMLSTQTECIDMVCLCKIDSNLVEKLLV